MLIATHIDAGCDVMVNAAQGTGRTASGDPHRIEVLWRPTIRRCRPLPPPLRRRHPQQPPRSSITTPSSPNSDFRSCSDSRFWKPWCSIRLPRCRSRRHHRPSLTNDAVSLLESEQTVFSFVAQGVPEADRLSQVHAFLRRNTIDGTKRRPIQIGRPAAVGAGREPAPRGARRTCRPVCPHRGAR